MRFVHRSVILNDDSLPPLVSMHLIELTSNSGRKDRDSVVWEEQHAMSHGSATAVRSTVAAVTHERRTEGGGREAGGAQVGCRSLLSEG